MIWLMAGEDLISRIPGLILSACLLGSVYVISPDMNMQDAWSTIVMHHNQATTYQSRFKGFSHDIPKVPVSN